MKKVWHGSRGVRKGGVRDFYRKPYGNPLFSRGRSRRGGGQLAAIGAAVKRTAIWALVLGVVGGAAWYAIWSPAFAVTTVEVTGASITTEQDIRKIMDERLSERTWLVIPERNLFFFEESAAIGAMGEKYLFESVQVRKKLPHTVMIDVKEKEPRASLVSGSRFLAVDGSGFVIRDLTEKEVTQIADLPPDVAAVQVQGLGAETMDVSVPVDPSPNKKGSGPTPVKRNKNPLPLIVEPSSPDANIAGPKAGDVAVSPGTLALILEAYSRLPDIAGAGVRWFTVDEQAEAVHVTMEGDWTIFISTSVPFDVQGQRLALVLKEKVGARKAELEYIDLRYNERIFFRFKTPAPPK